jgi:hypothetical protein
MRQWAFGLLGVSLLLTEPAGAGVGSLAGMTRNQDDDTLPGVSIEASSPVLIEKVRVASSDKEGFYYISALPEGTYKLAFTFKTPYDPATLVVRVYCATLDNVVVTPEKRTVVDDAVLRFCREERVVIVH